MVNSGHSVIGAEINEEYINTINAEQVPFIENNPESALKKAVRSGHLSAQKETPPSDVYIVAVPTPFKNNNKADLSYIETACRQLAQQLAGNELIILESTAPPETTKKLAEWILDERPDLNVDDNNDKTIHVAHCPERLLPGKIMEELVTNDRVIGGLTRYAAELARDVYSSFCTGKLLLTDTVTAEMTKLVENSFRNVNIAFANELSIISDKLGINVWELIKLANHHPRVNILEPGPGVGGHCIAVDPWFIVDAAPTESKLIKAAREVNDSKPQIILDKLKDAVQSALNTSLAILGLAFKPDIDDLRESPANKIAIQAAKIFQSTRIQIAEPNISQLPHELLSAGNVTLTSAQTAIQGSDLVLLLVDHAPFKEIPAALLKDKVIIDTKGIW